MASKTNPTLKYRSCSREREYWRCTLASVHANTVQLTSSVLWASLHVEQVAISRGSCFDTTALRRKQPHTSTCSWASSTLKGSSTEQIKSVHQVSRFNQELLCLVQNKPKDFSWRTSVCVSHTQQPPQMHDSRSTVLKYNSLILQIKIKTEYSCNTASLILKCYI